MPSFQFIVRVAKAFDTNITFPVLMTTVPPSSVDPALSSQEINRVLALIANLYLATRANAAAGLANDNAEEEAEARGQTARNGSGTTVNGKCWCIENNKSLFLKIRF